MTIAPRQSLTLSLETSKRALIKRGEYVDQLKETTVLTLMKI